MNHHRLTCRDQACKQIIRQKEMADNAYLAVFAAVACFFLTFHAQTALVPLDCRMSKYLSKKTLDDFLDGSAALTFAVISCSNCQNNWKLYSSSHIATVATDAEMGLYLENSKTAGGGNLGKTVRRVTRDKNARDKKMTFVHLFCSQMREDST